ncbi:AsmA family protein [Halieaceae bacterium IMCC14734]|uniref:AsmA family protein n=1 Tax=Candidatus Litorirhabdus singularis TaxID=2518993 RepID=A0ABT3TD71_9GAMM|nr:AsmA family protein [Candidatus Litorirhabdus singularis]MCX2980248.1 AsmA family protein [Candidatus Litorirhabdus singularis]
MKRATFGGLAGVFSLSLILVLLIGTGLLPLNLSLLRGTIAAQVSDFLGFELQLDAPLRVRLGPRASLTVGGLTLAAPAMNTTGLIRAQNLKVSLDTRALLRGEILLHSVRVAQLQLEICELGEVQSPVSEPGEAQLLPRLALDTLDVGVVSLLCAGEEPDEDYWPRDLSLAGAAVWGKPVLLRLNAEIMQQSLGVEIETTNLQSLLEGPASVPFNLAAILQAKNDRLELHFDGSINTLLTLPTLSGSLQASVRGAAGLLAPYEVEIPQDWGLDNIGLIGSLEIAEHGVALSDAHLVIDELKLQAAATLVPDDKGVATTVALQFNDFDLAFLNRFIDADLVLTGIAGTISADAESYGDSLALILDELRMNAELANVQVALDGQALPLQVNSANVAIGFHEQGQLELQGNWLDKPVTVSAQTPPLVDLMKQEEWPLSLEMNNDNARLALTGTIFDASNAPRMAGSLQFFAQRSGDLNGWLDINQASELDIGAEISFDIEQSSQRIEVHSLRLGLSALQGSLQRWVLDDKPSLALNLQASLLDLAELQLLLPALETSAQSQPQPLEAGSAPANQDPLGWLEDFLKGPKLVVDLGIKSLLNGSFKVDDVQMTGTVFAGRIEDANLELEYEDVVLGGKLDANFSQRPWSLEYDIVADNIDIGRVLESFDIATGVRARAKRAEITMQMRGGTVAELIDSANYHAFVYELDWLPRGLANDDEDKLFFSKLEFLGQPNALSIWRGTANYQQLPLDFLLRAPPLKELLDPANAADVQFALRAGSDAMLIDARIAAGSSSILDMELDMSAATLDQQLESLDELTGPLDAVRMRTRLELERGNLRLSDIDLQLGVSRILGSVTVLRRGSLTEFDVALDSPLLETEDLVTPIALLRGGRLADPGRDQQRERSNTASQAEVEAEIEEVPQTSSSEAVFFAMLNRRIEEITAENHLKFNLNIDELQTAGEPLGRASAAMFVDDTKVEIKPFSIEFPQGRIEAMYVAKYLDDGVQSSLKVDIERVQYGGLLRLFDADSEADGMVFLEVEATADGEHWNDLTGEIAGHLDVALFPKDIEAGFLDLWASNVILALLPSSGAESKKKMNCMVSRWTAQQGLVTSKNSFLDSTDIIVRVRGDVDLGREELDLLAVPQAKTERFLSVSAPIEVKGGFDDFTVALAPGSFFMTMTRWYYGLIYVPWKWLTGDRFPEDGIETCFNAIDWELPETMKP